MLSGDEDNEERVVRGTGVVLGVAFVMRIVRPPVFRLVLPPVLCGVSQRRNTHLPRVGLFLFPFPVPIQEFR